MKLVMKQSQIFHNLHCLAQAHRGQFKLDGLRVQYTGSNEFTQYIFNSPINHNQSAKFKLKVIQTKFNYIMIGVVNYALQKEQRSSYKSGNAMCYYGLTGSKYPNGGHEGEGFSQGDVVEVHVNRATSTMRYSVNRTLKAIHNHDMLADSSRVFMPYVEIYYTNDAVEWVME